VASGPPLDRVIDEQGDRDQQSQRDASSAVTGPLHPDVHILTVKMTRGMIGGMDGPSTDVIQGTLDMLILKTLSLEPMHGFGISRRIEQVSRGVFKVNPGSLLIAFQRLERAGLLDAEWRQTDNARRAKFYTLSRAGRKRLEVETVEWTRRAAAVARLLRAEG
jgi:PadR family transcriptional regulator PadR